MENLLDLVSPRGNTFHDLVQKSKLRKAHICQHRAISRLTITPYIVMQAIFIPLFFCSVILWSEPALLAFWRNCILFWAAFLDIPLQVVNQGPEFHRIGLEWLSGDSAAAMPTGIIMISTLLVIALGFFASLRMNGRMLPLKYLIRILCAVQAVALVYFLFIPAQFPYTITTHLSDIIYMGFMLIMATPVMLAMGYYVFDFSIWNKLKHTLLILLYFVIMIPHQAVLHLLIMQYFSVMFMPILFICFGAVFDVLIFVALYSWAASTIPADATS